VRALLLVRFGQIEETRKQSNLSSAIRLFVLEHFQNVDLTDARGASASAEETQPIADIDLCAARVRF
jgi:predicted DNA-binding ribbon-helix-helix protein